MLSEFLVLCLGFIFGPPYNWHICRKELDRVRVSTLCLCETPDVVNLWPERRSRLACHKDGLRMLGGEARAGSAE